MYELRPYQEESVERALASDKRIIECAPTGSGKTIIQAFVAHQGYQMGQYTAILTPRAEIFDQTHSALLDICGPRNVATLRAGQSWDSSKPIQVISWPTLVSRMRRGNNFMPLAHRVLVDECHLSMAPKISRVLDHYRTEEAHIVGYSATPARKSGKGLGSFYEEINVVRSVKQLIGEGFLVPCEYWGGLLPDLNGLKTVAGDFQKTELSKRTAVIVGDVVDNWVRLARDRHTIVFAVDIGHAEMLQHRFLEIGIAAGCIHNRLPTDRRAGIVERFKAGLIQVLVNVQIASYGFDDPSVTCVVAARPTKSIVLWLQMLGRGMRPGPGKTACMVLDHADNTRRLGMAEDDYRWVLGEKTRSVSNRTRDERDAIREQVNTCKECGYMWSGGRECPQCGWMIPFTKKDVSTIQADLVRIGSKKLKQLPDDWPDHEQFYRMLKRYAELHDYKPGWVAHKFKQKCDDWPPDMFRFLSGMPVDIHVKNWITNQNIRYAKGKNKTRAST